MVGVESSKIFGIWYLKPICVFLKDTCLSSICRLFHLVFTENKHYKHRSGCTCFNRKIVGLIFVYISETRQVENFCIYIFNIITYTKKKYLVNVTRVGVQEALFLGKKALRGSRLPSGRNCANAVINIGLVRLSSRKCGAVK